MSNMRSTPPPKRSFGAAEPLQQTAGPVIDDGLLGEPFGYAIERADFGFVWADGDLIATHRFGKLVDFVTLGQDVTLTVLPLFGWQDRSRRCDASRRTSSISPMSRRIGRGADRRGSISGRLDAARRAYLLSVSRVMSATTRDRADAADPRAPIVEGQLVEHSKAIARANRS